MVTYVERTTMAALVLFELAACGAVAPASPGGGGGADPASPGSASPGSTPGAAAPTAKYPGTGFVVHEWGTNTVVVGSDGSLQRGLHHEEEDLPAFVYDRLKAGALGTSVDVKMETPVTYFYSDKPLDAQVTVSFPKGVLTQWYPAVRDFYPLLAAPAGALADPVMDPRFATSNATCAAEYYDGKAIANGLLDWGSVSVLARGATVTTPDAPLDRFTWSHARAVDANPLRVEGATQAGTRFSESERFLFYRGLGNFALPATVSAGADGRVLVSNPAGSAAMGSVFFLDVSATTGAFVVHSEGLAAGAGVAEGAGAGGARPLDAYADGLAAAMTSELDKTGLYHDEALAMVNTWKRQWFRTPGRRVLYLAPQAWTDAQIPLKITPAPEETKRVMVIRVEVITPALEADDTRYAATLATDYAAGAAHFKALGRFAEPRLRRAMQLLQGGNSACAVLLGQIGGANTNAGAGE
jgi:hypothetical protein